MPSLFYNSITICKTRQSMISDFISIYFQTNLSLLKKNVCRRATLRDIKDKHWLVGIIKRVLDLLKLIWRYIFAWLYIILYAFIFVNHVPTYVCGYGIIFTAKTNHIHILLHTDARCEWYKWRSIVNEVIVLDSNMWTIVIVDHQSMFDKIQTEIKK